MNQIVSAKTLTIILIIYTLLSYFLITLLLLMTTFLGPRDDFSAISAKIHKVKKDIRKNQVIGYTNDTILRNESNEASKDYYFIRYLLVPALLTTSKKTKVVLANFNSANEAQKYITLYKLEIIKDYGNGMMLLKN